MTGYKAFDKDLKCRGFQFAVGETYEIKGKLQVCGNGFHFCESLYNVYNYYAKSSDTRICEVEAVGEVETEGDKSCTSKIKIVRELSVKEILTAVFKQVDSGNSGHYNSGDYNSGHYNSGDYNSGYYNSGYYNSGNHNSGSRNSGHYNAGNNNSGNHNSGDYNSGDYNSGNYNSGNYNSGFFNTNTPYARLFNKRTKLRLDSEEVYRLRKLSVKVKPILRWISSERMTEEEKAQNPSHKTTGGYLKNTGKNDFSDWNNPEDLAFFKSLPNFDAKIFEEITGIKVGV